MSVLYRIQELWRAILGSHRADSVSEEECVSSGEPGADQAGIEVGAEECELLIEFLSRKIKLLEDSAPRLVAQLTYSSRRFYQFVVRRFDSLRSCISNQDSANSLRLR
jgi:hypothetical protein